MDVSDPGTLRVAGSCDLGVCIWHAAVQGQYAYATRGGSVRVIDVSVPAAPKEVGQGAVECGEGITVAGKYADLACDDHGMHVVDISDPHAPKQWPVRHGAAEALGKIGLEAHKVLRTLTRALQDSQKEA